MKYKLILYTIALALLFIELPEGGAQGRGQLRPNYQIKTPARTGTARAGKSRSTSQLPGQKSIQTQARKKRVQRVREGELPEIIQMTIKRLVHPKAREYGRPFSKEEKTELVDRLIGKLFNHNNDPTFKWKEMEEHLTQSVEKHKGVALALWNLGEQVKNNEMNREVNEVNRDDLYTLLKFTAYLREINPRPSERYAANELEVLLGLGSHVSIIWNLEPGSRKEALVLLQTYNKNREKWPHVFGPVEIFRLTLKERGFRSPHETDTRVAELLQGLEREEIDLFMWRVSEGSHEHLAPRPVHGQVDLFLWHVPEASSQVRQKKNPQGGTEAFVNFYQSLRASLREQPEMKFHFMLSRHFQVDHGLYKKTEVTPFQVTKKQWVEVMKEDPFKLIEDEHPIIVSLENGRESPMRPDSPVENTITLWSALAFVNEFSRMQGLRTSYDFSEVIWKEGTQAEDGTLQIEKGMVKIMAEDSFQGYRLLPAHFLR